VVLEFTANDLKDVPYSHPERKAYEQLLRKLMKMRGRCVGAGVGPAMDGSVRRRLGEHRTDQARPGFALSSVPSTAPQAEFGRRIFEAQLDVPEAAQVLSLCSTHLASPPGADVAHPFGTHPAQACHHPAAPLCVVARGGRRHHRRRPVLLAGIRGAAGRFLTGGLPWACFALRASC
jgi:hypothetical protein